MSSRIAHHFDFAPYEVGELTDIARLMLEQTRYYLSEEAEAAFRHYITRRCAARFANARSVRNELERARLRHAHRLTSDPGRSWTRDDLMRIEPVGIWPAMPTGWPNPGSADPGRTSGALNTAGLVSGRTPVALTPAGPRSSEHCRTGIRSPRRCVPGPAANPARRPR